MMLSPGGTNPDVDCITKAAKSRDKKPPLCSEGWKFGGAKRDRTADLLHAMQALYQLSYTPEKNELKNHFSTHNNFGGESGIRTPDTRIMIPLL